MIILLSFIGGGGPKSPLWLQIAQEIAQYSIITMEFLHLTTAV